MSKGIDLKVSDNVLANAVYSNSTLIWHTPHEFTIDFLCNEMPADLASGPGGGDQLRLVARVRIPHTGIFDLIRALNENMSKYERQFGEIRKPW